MLPLMTPLLPRQLIDLSSIFSLRVQVSEQGNVYKGSAFSSEASRGADLAQFAAEPFQRLQANVKWFLILYTPFLGLGCMCCAYELIL